MDSDQSQGKTIDERLNAVMHPEVPQPTAEVQPEPVPSSNQQPTDETVDDLTLPENASERTRQQFEKLKSRLAEAEAKTKTPEPTQDFAESVFDIPESASAVYPESPITTQTTPQQFVDSEGNVDLDRFNQSLKQANDRAYIAQLEAQKAQESIAKFEHNQQTREALSQFKELDATKKDSFDPKFAELVRREIIANDQLSKKGIESKLSYAEAAQKVRGFYQPVDVAKVKEETMAQARQAQVQRQQGPIESGRGESRVSTDTLQELREKTRRGDVNALSERLRSIGA